MLRPYNIVWAFGISSRRTFADGLAKVAAVAHQQKRSDGFKRVQQAEHSALALAHGEGKRFEKRTLKRDPVGSRVHFVFRKFELSVADIFVGEEFYFLEPHDLRADKNIAVRMKMRGCFLAGALFSR